MKEYKIVLFKNVSSSININSFLDFITDRYGSIEDFREIREKYNSLFYIKFKRESYAKNAINSRSVVYRDKKIDIDYTNITSLRSVIDDKRNYKEDYKERYRSNNNNNNSNRYDKERHIYRDKHRSRSRSYSRNKKYRN